MSQLNFVATTANGKRYQITRPSNESAMIDLNASSVAGARLVRSIPADSTDAEIFAAFAELAVELG